jgi:hypothetical protein
LRKQKEYQLTKKQNYHAATKKRYPPNRYKNHQGSPTNGRFFEGNLVQNMRFGGKDHDLSGFVQRTIVMKDKFGNIQIAKEKQFFNSSKNGHNLRIKDDEKY